MSNSVKKPNKDKIDDVNDYLNERIVNISNIKVPTLLVQHRLGGDYPRGDFGMSCWGRIRINVKIVMSNSMNDRISE